MLSVIRKIKRKPIKKLKHEQKKPTMKFINKKYIYT